MNISAANHMRTKDEQGGASGLANPNGVSRSGSPSRANSSHEQPLGENRGEGGQDRGFRPEVIITNTNERNSSEWADVVESLVSRSKEHVDVVTHYPNDHRQRKRRISAKGGPWFHVKPWHILLLLMLVLSGSFLWNFLNRIILNSLLT